MKTKIGAIIEFRVVRGGKTIASHRLHNVLNNELLLKGTDMTAAWSQLKTHTTPVKELLPGTYSQSGNLITRETGSYVFLSRADLFVFSGGEYGYRLSGTGSQITVSKSQTVAETSLSRIRTDDTHSEDFVQHVLSQPVFTDTYSPGKMSWSLAGAANFGAATSGYSLERISLTFGAAETSFFDLPAAIPILIGDVVVVDSYKFTFEYDGYQPKALASSPISGITSACTVQRLRKINTKDNVSPTRIFLLEDANKLVIPDMLSPADSAINPGTLTIAETITAAGSKVDQAAANDYKASHSCYGAVAVGVAACKQIAWGTATELFGIIEFATPQNLAIGKAITIGAGTHLVQAV